MITVLIEIVIKEGHITMKIDGKYLIGILVFGMILGSVGCMEAVEQVTVNTSDNAKPENLYYENPDIDMFVLNGIAYVNAEDVDWVMTLNSHQIFSYSV